MSSASINLAFTFRNNVNYPVQIDVLGSPVNLRDTSNAKREFRWDVTSFTFTNEDSLIIQYKSNSATNFLTFITTITTQSYQGIADALNGLGIGFFQYYVESGQDYIGTYNDNYIFGQINVYQASVINPFFFYGTGLNLGSNAVTLGTQNNGTILVGGYFTTYNGTSVNYLVRIFTDGTIDTSFTSALTAPLLFASISLGVQSDGKIYVGRDSILVRLNSDGSIDNTFSNYDFIGSNINDIAVQNDNKPILVGNSPALNNGIVRLTTSGTVDGTFNTGTGFDQVAFTVKIQPDGKILVGGNFLTYNGNLASHIVRLNTDGSIDATFNTGTGFNTFAGVFDIYILPSGKILVSGDFNSYNGNAVNSLIRLNSDGSIDNTFNSPSDNANINSIVVISNGNIFASCQNSTYNGVNVGYIAQLDSNGNLITSWNQGNSGFDFALTSQIVNSGIQENIVVVGLFTQFNTTSVNYIISLIP
jgi:uncharacterized delta-60 repeat protein